MFCKQLVSGVEGVQSGERHSSCTAVELGLVQVRCRGRFEESSSRLRVTDGRPLLNHTHTGARVTS